LYFQKVKIDTLPLCCWWKPVVRDCGKIGPVKRQKRVGKYIVDVFFSKHQLAGHKKLSALVLASALLTAYK
jgi:hypothetical protein